MFRGNQKQATVLKYNNIRHSLAISQILNQMITNQCRLNAHAMDAMPIF